MIQAQTQTPDYWGVKFAVTDKDIEQVYNHFLEVERPQRLAELVRVIIAYRVAEELRQVERLMAGRTIYQPRSNYTPGQELVFPMMQFAQGRVTAVRKGYNPQYGNFNVIRVEINGKQREFAADLQMEHPLNADKSTLMATLTRIDIKPLYEQYGHLVEKKLARALEESPEFIRLGAEWFIKGLMLEMNIGHLHLAEAILEMNDGGPLTPEEIIPQLDLDSSISLDVQRFSLNYAMLNDGRFDEVAPVGAVAWFLKRLEPEGVRETPERLRYTPIPYDRALLSPQLLSLERELDDEWSQLEPIGTAEATTLTLTYPHRWAGTLPLSSRTTPLFPASNSPRQYIRFVEEGTGREFPGWVVREHRYVYGLKEWYEENELVVGAYIYLRPGKEPGKIIINFDRRRPQREWVRVASLADNQIKFELTRRGVGCGYDDLLIVATDVGAAIDVLARRIEANQRSVASLLAELFPQLASLNPQNAVHAKTLYSAINMFKRVPPGPIFAELVRHPAFKAVGDHYWRFESENWRS